MQREQLDLVKIYWYLFSFQTFTAETTTKETSPTPDTTETTATTEQAERKCRKFMEFFWYSFSFQTFTAASDQCDEIDNVYDQDTSAYLVSVCLVTKVYNHKEAEENCLAMGMELFVIANVSVLNGFFAAVMESGWDINSVLWIGGGEIGECRRYQGGDLPSVYAANCSDTSYSYCQFIDSNAQANSPWTMYEENKRALFRLANIFWQISNEMQILIILIE